eukprot:TRINITY_DN14482_c0_g1_i1.p1 TRINITY_DN14482_c0_g1~~TRINITY_DN14482_c0_g1_i1.p1  ORF type:complete len:527 (+),score=174.36 TRINITY_DN14482_c0_g1_i1:142-1722(+)
MRTDLFIRTLIAVTLSRGASALHADVLVYGATASGVQAAIAAAQENCTVILLEPRSHVGGMVSGGLGWTDVGNPKVIGGNTLDYYLQVGARYNLSTPQFHSEPHVNEDVYRAWLVRYPGITLIFQQRIVALKKSGASIVSVSTTSGDVHSASVWLDTTYEGDLLPLANVSYTWGRESVGQYNETFAGRLQEPWSGGGHQFAQAIDPYDSQGNLLPLVYSGDPGVPGQADLKVQAYNFRMCLTQTADNQVPIPPPKSYNASTWELFRRYLATQPSWSLSDLMIISPLPNGKTDINNHGPISTDFIGGSWEYPEAPWDVKEQIWEAHREYTKAFFYFLANDPAVPEATRKEMQSWGLAKDEFVDTDHWPNQLYVREVRRMVSDFVFTQCDRYVNVTKTDTIGLGSYNIDSHHAQRIPQNGPWPTPGVVNDGDVERSFATAFELPYSMLTPPQRQCDNLLVPVCTSASHIGYGCIRLEPQFQIMGQSAGVAAALAVRLGVPVQAVPIASLQQRLRELGQLLTLSDVGLA